VPGAEGWPIETAAELQARIEAERVGRPFLLYRDGHGAQRIAALADVAEVLTIGRDPGSDVPLVWDQEASRSHAQLARFGAQWAVVDDGLSRNGTFVNGERIISRRRLANLDVVVCGTTRIVFHSPTAATDDETRPATAAQLAPQLTPAQRRVLIGLCRPFKDRPRYALPASNREIADELIIIIVEAVRTHMKSLFDLGGRACGCAGGPRPRTTGRRRAGRRRHGHSAPRVPHRPRSAASSGTSRRPQSGIARGSAEPRAR
jgi:hypothetical protein